MCSSLYSSDDVLPTTLTGRGRQHSDDSLSSIVDSYSAWGSWAPSSPLTSPLLPPLPDLSMDSAVAPEEMGSTSTITSQSNTCTHVPPLAPPSRNRTRQLGPPNDVVVWRTSCLKTPRSTTTLDDLIELERTQLENGFIGDPPLSPLSQIAALQLKRDSGRFGNSGDDGRVDRSAVRPQVSMPTLPSSYHHGHVPSVSRFSESGSGDDDARSVRSMTSMRIRDGARGARDSFVRGFSGLNRPTSSSSRRESGIQSRMSNVSASDKDTTITSQRTSDTSATTLSPAVSSNSHKHKHTLSASTSRSVKISEDRSSKDAEKSKARDSVTRSWTSAFKMLFRGPHSIQRPESPLGRRKSNERHSPMASAPAKLPAPNKFFGGGIRQEKPRNLELPMLRVQALHDSKNTGGKGEGEKKKGRFSVRAMAGMRSKEEKRREQLKGLIRVVETDEQEKENCGPIKPNKPMREAPEAPEQVDRRESRAKEAEPGLNDEEMSTAAQMWL